MLINWIGMELKFAASNPDYKRFEKNNEDIALNILFVPFVKEEEEEEIIDVSPEYISTFNFQHFKI